MSASANADSDAPVPCGTPSCGFWGRPSTGNFCSRCYKEKTNEAKKTEKAENEQKEKKEMVEQKEASDTAATISKQIETKVSVSVPTPAAVKIEELPKVEVKEENKTAPSTENPEDGDKSSKKRKQKNRMRCFECRKKVGLTGIECSCGFVFCGVHRYPDAHKCDFDFKAEARERFQQQHCGKSAVVDKIVGEKL